MNYIHDDIKLISNTNTGIEYEYAVAYHLMSRNQKKDFYKSVITKHSKKNQILESITIVDDEIKIVADKWRNRGDYYVSLLPTQDDDLAGPSDILLCSDKKIQHGLSVKFDNKNTWSPTGRHFLTEEQIETLTEMYRNKFIKMYIAVMTFDHGTCVEEEHKNGKIRNNWYRKRCDVTDVFMDIVRTEVINNWQTKTLDEKLEIVKKGYHEDTNGVDCSIITLTKEGDYKIEEMQDIPSEYKNIELQKTPGTHSYISFMVDNTLIGKMQVKPNGGFIQREGNRNSFDVGGFKFGEADLFGSWNFEVVKIE